MDKSLPNRAIEWSGRQLILLDQRLLPSTVEFLHIDSVAGTFDAIKDMVVRGAPAIGVTAAYGVVLSALTHSELGGDSAKQHIKSDITSGHMLQINPVLIGIIGVNSNIKHPPYPVIHTHIRR